MRTAECGSVVRRVSAAVVLILAILASPALAQTADRPNVKVGDEWQFASYFGVPPAKPNRDWVVTSVTPAGIVGTSNGNPLLLTAELNLVDSPMFRHSDFRLLNFPLEVGKKWTFSSNDYDKVNAVKFISDYNVTVINYAKVRVLAGEFDAFKLEAQGKYGQDGAAGAEARDILRTYWYAPAVRAIVKEEVVDQVQGQSTVELMSFKLQP